MTTKAEKPETGKKAAAKATTTKAAAATQAATPRKRRSKKDDTPYVPPKRLSKMALWVREHGPAIEIIDYRAVMK
jgi:hypothetical protein